MAKHFEGTPKQERALGTFVKLMRASETVHARVTRHLAGSDLTPTQFAVLEALYHVGPLCLSELAQKILKTGGNLTMVAGNLERRGLVRKLQQEHDRRFVQVAITPKGRALMDKVFPRHLEEIVAAISILSPAEQQQLGDLCRKLGTSLV